MIAALCWSLSIMPWWSTQASGSSFLLKSKVPILTADSALINKTRSAQVTIFDLFSLEQDPDHVNGS